jgi:hypothetical protein
MMGKIISLLAFVLFSNHASAFILRNVNSPQRCLEILRTQPNDWRHDRNAQLAACNNLLPNQQIHVLPRGEVNGRLSFVLRMMNRCLEVDQTATRPWTPYINVQLQPCRGLPHQRWFLDSVGPDWQKVRSVVDGRCLIVNLEPYDGWRFNTNLEVSWCQDEIKELWRFDD